MRFAQLHTSYVLGALMRAAHLKLPELTHVTLPDAVWKPGRVTLASTEHSRSRYTPHQGKRECARRFRQMQKAEATAVGSPLTA